MKNWLLSIFCVLTSMLFAQEATWELKRDKSDLKVYVRQAEDSPFKELKMQFSIESSMAEIQKQFLIGSISAQKPMS